MKDKEVPNKTSLTNESVTKPCSRMGVQECPIPRSLTHESVLSITHWTESLFSFSITRPLTFKFRSGEFIMLGIFVDQKPLLRAYSITSPPWDEKLSFYSIKINDGPLTSQLQHMKISDKILLGKKPTGTLTLDALTPGKTLYMLSTGTGIAPFLSLIRDPETYEKYDNIILAHTCRFINDLEYGTTIINALESDPLVAQMAKDQFTFYPTLTQGHYHRVGRLTTLIKNGAFFRDIERLPFQPDKDRVMICGSTAMLHDLSTIVKSFGLSEGSNATPAEFVIEKAFVT